MELRKKLISVAALAFTVALGAGMATMTASAEEELTGFAITEFSVRVNGKTDDEGNDTSGLRFKTVTPEGKEAYDAYYTVLSIEGKGSKTVWADTWRSTNDGWNTVVMGIPQSDYQTDITATSYVEIDGEVFATDAATLNLSEAASLAIKTAKTQADAIAINKYIWTEGSGEGVTRSYTISDYAAGTQYAENEVHKLDDNVTITTTKCHFTSELRIYSSTTYNGFAVISANGPIVKLAVNAGNKQDTINVYGSNDGTTWTTSTVATIKTTTTSYKDYSVDIANGYKYLKLDVDGTQQVRVKTISLTIAGQAGGYGLGEVPLVLPEAESELTIPDILILPLKETTETKYYVTSTVKNVYFGSSYVTLYLKDADGNELTCYDCNYDEVAVKPAAGDTVTVYGALGTYQGTPQLVKPEIQSVIVCDKNKAQAVLDQLTFAEEDLAKLESGTRDITLPTATADYDFDVEWTAESYATIEDGKVVITAPADKNDTATFSVSVTVGDETVSNSFAIIVGVSQGTETTVAMDIFASAGTGRVVGTDTISWTSGGVTFTNNKAGSTNAIRTTDSDHFRVYAKSEVVISTASGTLTKVVITCVSGYADDMETSLKNAGYKVSVSGNVVTVTGLNTESITFTASAQTRLSKVEVTYVG